MDKWTIGLKVLQKIEHKGYKAYIVGGAVRDYCLKKPIQDVDITTNALPSELKVIFPDAIVYPSYLSTKVFYKQVLFEITTFRKDLSYMDYRHPIVQAVDTIEEDLKRRDFTINALAMDSSLNIIDLYTGVEDLNSKKIRCIGNPEIRFKEDAYRVLRAIELSSRYNFDLDKSIQNSFKNDYLKHLKEEYILPILDNILNDPYWKGLSYICEFALLRSYPFYQVMIEECITYSCKDAYALFYCLHNFIPTNIKISKERVRRAKDIAYYVRNDFNAEALYYGNQEVLLDSISIYQKIKREIQVEEVNEKYQNLPIHKVKDICFDFSTLDKNKIGRILPLIEKKLLQNELKNTAEEITAEIRRIL